MRAHSNEHGDSLPVLDVSSLKHVAYVLDALVYYMRADTAAVNCQALTPPIMSESVETEPWIIDQVSEKNINLNFKSNIVNYSLVDSNFRLLNIIRYLVCYCSLIKSVCMLYYVYIVNMFIL